MADNVSPFYISPTLTAIAIKYRQSGMVADAVLPRSTVDHSTFIHLKDALEDWITPPETRVGRTSAPNQLNSSTQTPVTSSTQDNALDEPVPNRDEKNGPAESALGRATQRVMGLIELRREIRAAAIYAAAANFSFTTTLSGTSQWSDYVNSDPMTVLLKELDKPFMRPNALVLGQDVWTTLRQHPKTIAAIYGAVNGGVVDLTQLAAKLEVDEIIVGKGWYNTAVKGQTPNQTRIWGKLCCGVHLGPDSGNTWGYTAEFGGRVAGTIVDPNIGMWGGVKVRAGESVKEVVAAPEFGFQFLAAVA